MRHARWAVILAGGEGLRLRALTTLVAGDERPKQFCTFLDGQTLLDHTRRRAAMAVAPERTLLVLTRAHQRYYAPLLADTPAATLVVQPASRGTAPAILYALLRVAAVSPLGSVALLPSDHWVSDEALFMAHVEAAFEAAEGRPDLVILLGVRPDSAETEFGWIEPGELVVGQIRRVRRFWEKPALGVAEALRARGCLWNSFVIVAGVSALLSLLRRALPGLVEAFAGAGSAIGTPREAIAVESAYARLSPTNFSETVLVPRAANLAVLPVTGVEWSDWGLPRTVLASLARLGVHPAWAGAGLPRSA